MRKLVWVLAGMPLTFTAVHAADVADLDPLEYIQNRLEAGRAALDEDLADIKEAEGALSKPADPAKVKALKERLSLGKSEFLVLNDVANKTFNRVNDETEMKEILEKALLTPENKAKIQALSTSTDPAATVASKIDLEGSPLDLVVTASKNAAGKTVLKFSFDPNEAKNENFSRLTKRDTHNTTENIRALVDSQVNAELKPVEIELVNFDANPEAAVAETVNRMKGVFGVEGTVAKKVKEHADARNVDRAGSAIAEVREELSQIDGVDAAKEKLKSLGLNRKLAGWLKENSPKGMEPCQVLNKALGGLKSLPSRLQQECQEVDPKAKAAIKDEEKKVATTEQKNEQQVQQNMASVSAEFQGVMQSCQALVAQVQSQKQSQGIENAFSPVLQALYSIGASPSKIFNRMVSEGDQYGQGFDAEGSARDGIQRLKQGMQSTGNAQLDRKNLFDEIQKEYRNVDGIMSQVNRPLNQLSMMLGPNWMNDPMVMSNPKVQQMVYMATRYRENARVLQESLSRELDTMRAQNFQNLGSGGGYSTSGVPVVGGSGGSGSWRSVTRSSTGQAVPMGGAATGFRPLGSTPAGGIPVANPAGAGTASGATQGSSSSGPDLLH